VKSGVETLNTTLSKVNKIQIDLGFRVIVAHGHGERSMYAHLSRIDVRLGVWISQGVRVGLIGATGDATGPHLHFEVRIRGASVDPLRALPLGEGH